MEFKTRLKELRKKSPLTQKEISEKLGISVSAYQYYEVGKNEPNIEKLKILADTFNVTLDYLTGRTDE